MRMFDLDSLEIFRAVAREGGILRAAEKLNRVPSNITTRIKQMEQRLEVPLLRKRGRRVVLTEAGETLLIYAERLLRLASEAEDAAKTAMNSGPLEIGSMESTAASRLPSILSRFHSRHPDIRLTIETGTTGAIIRKVMEHQLDAGFVGEPFKSDGLQQRAVFKETLALVTARTHQTIQTAYDLQSQTILSFAKGCSYRKRLEEWLAGEDVEAGHVLELASYQAIVACAAAGAGCGIMPISVVESLGAGQEIKCHPLPQDVAQNTTCLVWKGNASPQLQCLISELNC